MIDNDVGQLMDLSQQLELAHTHLHNSDDALLQAQVANYEAASKYDEAMQKLNAFVQGVNEDV